MNPTQTHKIDIYSTPNCHFCHMTKDFLTEKGIPFNDFDVASDMEKRKMMIDISGQMGVPVIIIDDKDVIVGFNKMLLVDKLGIIEN